MKLPFESRTVKPSRNFPFPFILEALAPLAPTTRLMFGCQAIYVEHKIVLILRDKSDSSPNNGVWVYIAPPHQESLLPDFAHLHPVEMRGKVIAGWQVIPIHSPGFEAAALQVCQLILRHDPRIGKVPKPKRRKPPTAN